MVKYIRHCAMIGCDEYPLSDDAFCARHSFEVQVADEIERQPLADEIAGDAARLRWGVDVQPPQRPADDGRWTK